jgi:hypothetical protein
MGCIKGTSWLHVISHLKNNFSEADIERLKNQLLPCDREHLFEKKIFELSWVDFGAYMRFSYLADKLLGQGNNQLIKDIEFSAVRKHSRGIYKFLFSLLSWKFVVKKAGSVWRTYFNSGQMETLNETKTSITLKLTDFPDIPLGHEKFQEYYLEELMRLCGIKNPVSRHTKCIARGDDCCLYEYTSTWE